MRRGCFKQGHLDTFVCYSYYAFLSTCLYGFLWVLAICFHFSGTLKIFWAQKIAYFFGTVHRHQHWLQRHVVSFSLRENHYQINKEQLKIQYSFRLKIIAKNCVLGPTKFYGPEKHNLLRKTHSHLLTIIILALSFLILLVIWAFLWASYGPSEIDVNGG